MKSILKPMLAILALTLSGVAMTAPARAQVEIDITPVSYTHLTLPTICSV